MHAITVDQLIVLLQEQYQDDDMLVVTWWTKGDLPDEDQHLWDEHLASEFAYAADPVIERGNEVLDYVLRTWPAAE